MCFVVILIFFLQCLLPDRRRCANAMVCWLALFVRRFPDGEQIASSSIYYDADAPRTPPRNDWQLEEKPGDALDRIINTIGVCHYQQVSE